MNDDMEPPELELQYWHVQPQRKRALSENPMLQAIDWLFFSPTGCLGTCVIAFLAFGFSFFPLLFIAFIFFNKDIPWLIVLLLVLVSSVIVFLAMRRVRKIVKTFEPQLVRIICRDEHGESLLYELDPYAESQMKEARDIIYRIMEEQNASGRVVRMLTKPFDQDDEVQFEGNWRKTRDLILLVEQRS